jgi:hypothetical protein
LTCLIVLVSAHDVLLSLPVVVATHVSDWTVVTESGTVLTLRDIEVDTPPEVLVPNNVAVGLELHAILWDVCAHWCGAPRSGERGNRTNWIRRSGSK